MKKTIQLSPFEPCSLNLRAPAGLDLLLLLTIKTPSGGEAVIAAVQPVLELTGRSGVVVGTYAATDRSGSSAVAAYSIPGGVLKDPNGYRLRLVGWVQDRRELLAFGFMEITMGTEGTVSGGSSPDVIGTYTLQFVRGDSRTWQFTLWADTAKTIKSDLTGAVVTAQIRAAPGDPVLADMTCEVQGDPVAGVVWMSISASQTAGLPVNAAYWDMQVTYDSGEIRTPIGGAVRVVSEITRSEEDGSG